MDSDGPLQNRLKRATSMSDGATILCCECTHSTESNWLLAAGYGYGAAALRTDALATAARSARPGRRAVVGRRGSTADGNLLNPADMVPQVLIADVGDPDGDRVRVVGQFFWLVVGSEPLQIVLGQSGDGGEELLVRTP
jgi:hypothetical protein